FKPAKGQFQIFYQTGNESSEYVPDFVAETPDTIYMIETKAENQLSSPEVQSKKKPPKPGAVMPRNITSGAKGNPGSIFSFPMNRLRII
ncbi:MAG: hypothetical protein LBI67_03730, partial [Treponema sp.]|nr:hypothetical protein [Treponema sp.]